MIRIVPLSSLAISVALFAAPITQAATITYNASESTSQGPNGAAIDFSASNPTGKTFGSAGYILYAANPSYSDPPKFVSKKDPLTFDQDGFKTLNTLAASQVVAKSIDQDTIVEAGYAGGTPPDKSSTYFFGTAGTTTAGKDKAKMVSLTFKQPSVSGYRIAILTRPLGPNGGAVSGVSLSSGVSSASAKAMDERDSSKPNAIAFYSFDVTNIKAGDVVTLTLSQPSDTNLLYSGLTVDALPAPGATH